MIIITFFSTLFAFFPLCIQIQPQPHEGNKTKRGKQQYSLSTVFIQYQGTVLVRVVYIQYLKSERKSWKHCRPPHPTTIVNTSTMSTNTAEDSCIPDELKDFIFDLHDSVSTSHIPSEQAALYGGKFRELTAKVSNCRCFCPYRCFAFLSSCLFLWFYTIVILYGTNTIFCTLHD